MIFRAALRRTVLIALAALGGIGIQLAHAGASGASLSGHVQLLSFPSTVLGSTGGPQTLTIFSNGTEGVVNAITSVQLAGANAGDFALVGGGTCVLNSPLPTLSSCTQNFQFNPSAQGTRTAVFMITCGPAAMIGGFTVLCDNMLGTMLNLEGIGALVVQNIPTLDPKNLTLLGVLLIVLAGYYGLRRRND